MSKTTRTYKGYTIVAKTDPATYFYDEQISCVPEELPHVAEIYYPNGEFMSWVSAPQGKFASMRSAALCINEYLNPHEPDYDNDWHEQELWGREDY